MPKQRKNQSHNGTAATHNTKPWWRRPLFGKGGIIDYFLSKFRKAEVGEATISFHNREMMDIRFLAKTAQSLDDEKFGNPEFLLLIKLKYLFAQGMNEFKGLTKSMKLLQVAIAAKESFIKIDQTELRYRGLKQQEVYQCVENQLKRHHNDTIYFRQEVEGKLTEMLPLVKTKEGKLALQSYGQSLRDITKHKLGIKLLARFKSYQLQDYSILQTLSDMLDGFAKKDLADPKTVMSSIIVNSQLFETLADSIDMPQSNRNPESYCRMVQYIALERKYKKSTSDFEELLKVMRRWYPIYQAIIGIRAQHPPSEYRQPKAFEQPVPGETIYLKYKRSLTDTNTGYSYFAVEEDG